MILNNIYIEHQSFDNYILKEVLIHCYNNICFSTYPYISYHISTSKEAIEKYNSGNCIGMSYFIKQYLKNNYGIHSHQIIASAPEHYRLKGQSYICHVALLVCKSDKEYFILDPAFHFLEPIHIHKSNKIKTYDIHGDKVIMLHYLLQECSYREALPNTYSCVCYFEDFPENTFEYIFNAITNPDETIGNGYHSIKSEPFLVQTKYEKDRLKKIYHIKEENGHPIVIHNYKVIPYNYNTIHKDLYKFLRHTRK